MKPVLTLGPTIQSRPDCCPSCDGRRIIKRGLRKNSLRQLQIYWCRDCGRYFASLMGLKGVKYPPRAIMRALCLYNLGLTQEETARRILTEHHLRVPRRTVSNWIASFQSITTFHRLRAAAFSAFGCDMIRDRILEHRQEYHYQVHHAKLALIRDAVPPGIARKIENYLLSIFDDFPHHLFRDDQAAQNPAGDAASAASFPEPGSAMRSSQSSFETLPFMPVAKENLANDLAALGLLLARKSKDRHPCIQDFMLANDSCTIACEVPVYLRPEELAYYRAKNFFIPLPEFERPMTGHIDVVQLRNGLVHLLDYKPNACDIDPVNQLLIYALAFASRTRLPLLHIQCGWFDERDYYSFYPLQALRAKAA